MLLGLNRLQAVNLAFGRGGGDRILAEVARRIVQVLGEELGPRGLVARVSGGEFLIASDAPLSRERWQGVAQVLGRAIARPLRLDSLRQRVGPWARPCASCRALRCCAASRATAVRACSTGSIRRSCSCSAARRGGCSGPMAATAPARAARPCSKPT
jgi:GGDEF domain-containing protein